MILTRYSWIALFLTFLCTGWPRVVYGAGVLRLEFRAQDQGSPLEVGGQSAFAGSQPLPSAAITRLDWLVSRLALQRQDGTWTEGREWFGYLSAAENRWRVEADGVPVEKFRAIRFHVGVESAVDRADPAQWPAAHPLNPQVNHLHWGWQGGYVFLALEGRWPGTGGKEAFSYHLAGAAEPMIVELPVDFRGGGPVTILIGLDVAKLLRGIDPERDANATHSRAGDSLAQRLKTNVTAAFHAEDVRYDLLQAAPTVASPSAARIAGTKPFPLEITQRFPQVKLPADNPLTVEGVALGRRLFHDPRLSINSTQSCASCHDQAQAFSDPRRFSIGAAGKVGKRNAMPLFNLAWAPAFFWDGRSRSLREQVLEPIQDAHEMNERLGSVVAKLAGDAEYPAEFERAFGRREITADRLALALEQFLLTLISQESRFDRAVRKRAEMTEEEKRGLQLFVTEFDPARGLRGADCFHCHGGTLFTDHQFHDNGLALAATDLGRMVATGHEVDRGKFKTPSLRNIAVTAPYMHDGRFATLEEVVEHYDTGVRRNTNLDPNLAKHPAAGLQLTAEEKRALVAFLKTLTDEPFTTTQPGTAALASQTGQPDGR